MKNCITLELRRFPLLVVKQDNLELYAGHMVLTKEQLHAAQLVGQSSKELIHRLCVRQGYIVIEIGRATKKTVRMDADALWGGEADGKQTRRDDLL